MFARTPRLTLRPGWPEDAVELAMAIGHPSVCRNLARVPWPYALGDAQRHLAEPRGATVPRFVVLAHDHARPRLIGGIGLDIADGHGAELGYWISPDAWNRGYATEAARAVLDMAPALRIRRITARPMVDNPASGRVLQKLGFRSTGRVAPLFSQGRGGAVACAEYALDLGAEAACPDPRMAA